MHVPPGLLASFAQARWDRVSLPTLNHLTNDRTDARGTWALSIWDGRDCRHRLD
jgi:hypothetical protein